jgi:PAS domain S-box-containing protein
MINETRGTNNSALYPQLLNELLKRSSQAILLLDTDAEIIFCSSGMQSITGYTCEELTGRTAFDFFHPDDLPAAKQQHQQITGLHENAASLIQIRNKEGHMIWIDVVVNNMLHVPGIEALFVLLKKSSDVSAEERKLVQAVAQAKEQEREFLATELHDNINQIITATKLLVDTARYNSNKEELLQLSSDNLQLVADEIRKLSYSMVSYDLQEFGLSFAVNAFITTISRGCPVRFRTTLEQQVLEVLTSDQQLQLYRIIQESINNIIRHAQASLADITLTGKDGLVYLTISDNGKGFSMNRLKPGVGMASITNRVKILKGHFHVRAPQGKGTTIEIHFPV